MFPKSTIVVCLLFLIAGCKSDSGGTVADDPAAITGEIVTSQNNGVAKPDGWKVVESSDFSCSIPLLETQELKNDMIMLDPVSGATFSFGMSERDRSFDNKQIAEQTAGYLRGMDTKLFSQEMEVGDGLYCLAFSHEGKSVGQMARIYITDKSVWCVTASYSPRKEKYTHPNIKFFFDQFKVNLN